MRRERRISGDLKFVRASFQNAGSAGFPLMLWVSVFRGTVERTAPRPSPVRQNHASSACFHTAFLALR